MNRKLSILASLSVAAMAVTMFASAPTASAADAPAPAAQARLLDAIPQPYPYGLYGGFDQFNGYQGYAPSTSSSGNGSTTGGNGSATGGTGTGGTGTGSNGTSGGSSSTRPRIGRGSGQSGSGQGQSGSGQGGANQGQAGQSGTGAATSSTTANATASQSTGMVLINTTLDYGAGEAAGTGMIIESDGIVVTNHHVVADSTQVNVTIPATGNTYTADVLGYDTTDDVAILQLEGASGLTTVTTDTDAVSTGQSITTVGNAEGGNQLIASNGQITDTGVNITVTEDTGGTANLTNLIQVDSTMVPGDSGGALLDSDGEVVGMNVAGSTNTRAQEGYCIPITTVLGVAKDVLAGQASSTITLGNSAALGIEVDGQSSSTNGVTVVNVFDGSGAQQAGLTAGSVITSLDGKTITDNDSLAAVVAAHKPGDTIKIAWTDSSGKQHSASITLGTGPLP
jgi:S1-C subfamily serine protease